MIKQNELIAIGNYLKYGDKIIQVAGIRKNKIGYHETKDKLTWVQIRELDGIKLEAKMLFNNGFYTLHDTNFKIYEYAQFFINNKLHDKTNQDILFNYEKETYEFCHFTLKYFHELQNLLTLFGIKIDFKL